MISTTFVFENQVLWTDGGHHKLCKYHTLVKCYSCGDRVGDTGFHIVVRGGDEGLNDQSMKSESRHTNPIGRSTCSISRAQ